MKLCAGGASVFVKVLWLVVIVAGVSCVGRSEPRSPCPAGDGTREVRSRPSLESVLKELRLRERRFAKLITAVPGFGGYYLDDGKLIVALSDLSQTEAAAAAIPRHVSGDVRSAVERITVENVAPLLFRKVEYSFLQLATWRNRIWRPVLDTGGFISMTVDERDNVIRVGVVDERTREGVLSILKQASVPRDAVCVQLEEYPVLQ